MSWVLSLLGLIVILLMWSLTLSVYEFVQLVPLATPTTRADLKIEHF